MVDLKDGVNVSGSAIVVEGMNGRYSWTASLEILKETKIHWLGEEVHYYGIFFINGVALEGNGRATVKARVDDSSFDILQPGDYITIDGNGAPDIKGPM